jgi:prepilin-type N-terminal cleavage/methylation domain-containing protein
MDYIALSNTVEEPCVSANMESPSMKSKSEGFTLIELIVVMVIIGILAAIAIPRYIDLTREAKRARDLGLLDSLRSASTFLYASNVLNNVTNGVVTNGYWPTIINITNQMSDPVGCTNWSYYTNVTYNITSGTWTAYSP